MSPKKIGVIGGVWLVSSFGAPAENPFPPYH
jgi:hypothetical protein